MRFYQYLKEFTLGDEIEEIEFSLNGHKKRKFKKILKKYDQNFDHVDDWSTKDHIENMDKKSAQNLYKELVDKFNIVA